MKTLDVALLAEQTALVSRPALLLRIGFSTPLRACSFGDVSWDGQLWPAASLQVDDFASDGGGQIGVRLRLGNTDGAIGALLLLERLRDRSVELWEAWIDAAGSPQVKPAFSGVGADFEIGPTEAALSAVLAQSDLSHAPREMITPANGFTRLRPPGFKVNWNGVDYTLERP